MSVLRSKIALFAATAGLTAGTVALATPASADVISDGSSWFCYHRICLSYNGDGDGAWWTSEASEWTDLEGQKFHGGVMSGTEWNGYGQPVKNAAAWVGNGGSQDIYVYVNSKAYGWGAYDVVYPGRAGNLQVTRNNEAAYSTNVYS
ncbi:hypothetical protein PUR71_13000 [Streptomyces sp. SP17BM10]|uniref:hypothetical protein n=1 Tax=Streptomyces sp. SP17BM10 TaxID=3002530 RepID=UPI002E773D49|nr:hypothetical protein [Streptomyces sp. SP17BM10]MEE1783818.1 hypothetical protein [Streptomyces sp. SP17BM10]